MRFLLAVLMLGIALVPVIVGAVNDTDAPIQPANLSADVLAQIVGTGADQFGARGVASVACSPPSTWSTGYAFTCVAYSSSGKALGTYHGTVEATSGSEVHWKARWTSG
jgi:hypothetical protein